jgi:DNA-binding transcriptional LysR family regulator
MKLSEMRAFVAVADTGSIQQAAERLGLTQPAVSRLIQRLEAQLGTKLVDRQSRPLATTREGDRALLHARRVLKSVASFADDFAKGGPPSGPFRVGVTLALDFLLSAVPVADLRSAFPDVSLHLSTGWSDRMLRAVERGALDAAILVTPAEGPSPSPGARCLTREDVAIVGARGSPFARRTLANLNEIGWVLQPQECLFRRALVAALERQELSLNLLAESYSLETLLGLAARGVGYGLAPYRLVELAGLGGGLRLVPAPEFDFAVAVWFVVGDEIGRLAPVAEALGRSLADLFLPNHAAA